MSPSSSRSPSSSSRAPSGPSPPSSSSSSSSSSSWSWRRRLQSYLLRRALGPYLTPASASALHESVEAFDLVGTEGKVALTDVDLDPDRLTEKLAEVARRRGPPSAGSSSGGTGGEGDGEDGVDGASGGSWNVAVVRARVRRVAIRLTARDVDSSAGRGGSERRGGASSAARRAAAALVRGAFGDSFGGDDDDDDDEGGAAEGGGSSGVALAAHVEIEGLELVLGPGGGGGTDGGEETEWSTEPTAGRGGDRRSEPRAPASEEATATPSSATPGFLSSLVDAALKSLRLSVDVTDVRIRACADGDDCGGACSNASWAELRLASARYYDLVDSGTPGAGAAERGEKTILSKALDWEGITIDVGGGEGGVDASTASRGTSSRTFESAGAGRVRFRAREARSVGGSTTGEEEDAGERGAGGGGAFVSTRRDVEVSLGQRMAVELDLSSIAHATNVVDAMTRVPEGDGDFVDARDDDGLGTTPGAVGRNSRGSDGATVDDSPRTPDLSTDEFGREAYDRIMRRYAEARHRARTRELRGGLLVPSFDARGGGEAGGAGGECAGGYDDMDDVSFDAFFDANDRSVGCFCSATEEGSWHEGLGERGATEAGGRRGARRTKVELGLEEFALKVHLSASSAISRSKVDREPEHVLLTMGDLRLIRFGSDGESKLNLSASHFDVEGRVVDGADGRAIDEPVLRFLDPDDGGGAGMGMGVGAGDGALISAPPCVSLMAEVCAADEDGGATCQVDVTLQPLRIGCDRRILRRLSEFAKSLPVPEASAAAAASDDDGGDAGGATDVRASLSCPSILLTAPARRGPGDARESRPDRPDALFRRHGYVDRGSWGVAGGGDDRAELGIELDDVAVDLSRRRLRDDAEADADDFGDGYAGPTSEESKASATCGSIVLFARRTALERPRGRRRKHSSYVSRRADLAVLAGDEDGPSDAAAVSVAFSSIDRRGRLHPRRAEERKGAFPIILPLSSAKARQEADESDDEDEAIDRLDDPSREAGETGDRIRPSDPQYVLSSEANEAAREVVVTVPNVFFDSTTLERRELSEILSSVRSEDESDDADEVDPALPDSPDENLLGLAVNVGQLSLILHGSQHDGSNSYSLIMDKMQMHTLVVPSGVRNVRFLSHDVTLYELSNSPPDASARGRNQPACCAERCERVRERLIKCPSTLARAIFFRQKLCQSLSPETPALLVDLLFRGDEGCSETSVHVNLYDMSYRYIMSSEWLTNLTALIKGEPDEERMETQHDASDSHGMSREEINMETSSSLINLFVNVSDCNVDYTPPKTFRNASRIILRMGEIRLTSNIVTPSAAIQAYKLSTTDLRLHICNYRHSYNEENSQLSCAHRHLIKDDLFVPERAKCLGRNVVGLDDALGRMDFVNVAVLDKLEANIFKSNRATGARPQKEPATTVALTLGKLSIYACQDSFACLIQTYNEWFIKTSALSEEELERLRALSEPESEADYAKEIILAENECLLPLQRGSAAVYAVPKAAETPRPTQAPHSKSSSASSQRRPGCDGTNSLDLTQSLLFQNYYTFDAKSNRPQIELQGTEEMVNGDDLKLQSSSSEDEWAAVEHDFIQHSNIPRERDQTTGWVLCDKGTHSKPARTAAAATSPDQSHAVKVFPQHIPVTKPMLDPFAESAVDTAKLAGTDIAPDVKMRVVMKGGSVLFRCLDGLDWVNDAPQFHTRKKAKQDRKKELLSSLIDGEDLTSGLNVAPLPEERSKNLLRDIAKKKLRRNPHRYFQMSMIGLKVKFDSFAESKDHQLASCLDLSVSDFFIAETVSEGDPIKMMGEWVNEKEHPRDDNDGIIMLRQFTKHPKLRVSSDGKLMSDESRATLELLPLRCYFNQNALRFIRSFFAGSPNETRDEDSEGDGDEKDIIPDDEIIDIFFEAFKVRLCKLKVDYQPETMDIDSFREGNYIEILNLCPLEEMILNLQPVDMQDLTGWGSVFGELAARWIEDICSTQAHKFLTRASPFQPFSNLGDPLADLAMVLVVPEGNIADYFKGVVGGTTNLAGKVALEALSTSAKLTRFAANQLNSKALPSAGHKSSLPRRPRNVPRHAGDAAGHAYESVARGLREANYKIVTVPLREYQNSGAGGAARSALKGIPIGVIAPIAGASEALSYTLLGLRNQLRPDIRKEEEASLRGLNYD
ncbi:hypothetical protein ACHAWF_017760 [Thalassiosira exigua]